jgi:hypothetical protein
VDSDFPWLAGLSAIVHVRRADALSAAIKTRHIRELVDDWG